MPWLFVAAITTTFAVLVWPRLVLPSIGSIAALLLLALLAGPYVIAAVMHSMDVLRGRTGRAGPPGRAVDR